MMLGDVGMVICLIAFAATIVAVMKMADDEIERTKWTGDDDN